MNLTKQEALNKIEELKAFVGKMDSEEDEWYEPKDGEIYWYVNSCGVFVDRAINPTYPPGRFTHQQVYRTQEEAELADRRRIAETNIKRFIAKNGYGVKKEDWEDRNVSKLAPIYDYERKSFSTYTCLTVQYPGAFYVNSVEAFEHLIREHEADLKLLADIK